MKLAKAKVAGLHGVKNSGWFYPDKKLTILAGPDGLCKTTILKALLTLNPIPTQQNFSNFRDYPKYFFTRGNRRKVDPAKKTAAFGVFTCSEKLFNQLVNLDPVLYETDMIEVGRRLDLSRWITFVEIATSTRWSEIAKDTFAIQDFIVTQTNSQKPVDQFEQFIHINNTDRIKGEIAENIEVWLNTIEKFIDAAHRTLYDRVRFGVHRFNRFIKAQQAVSDNLPHFLYFSNSHLLHAEIELSKRNTDNNLIRFFELESKSTASSKVIKQCENRVNTSLKQYWPEVAAQISLKTDENILLLSVQNSSNNKIPLDKGDPVLLWQVSLAVSLLANNDNSTNDIILLLDEPNCNMGKKDQERMRDAINQIAQSFQIIVTTKSSVFIQEDDIEKRLQLLTKEDEESGTTVESAESFKQITDIL